MKSLNRPKIDSTSDSLNGEVVVWEAEETISEAWIKCSEDSLIPAVDVQEPHYKQ